MTVREALNSAIDDEMAKDESVFVIGEEVSHPQPASILRLCDWSSVSVMIDTATAHVCVNNYARVHPKCGYKLGLSTESSNPCFPA